MKADPNEIRNLLYFQSPLYKDVQSIDVKPLKNAPVIALNFVKKPDLIERTMYIKNNFAYCSSEVYDQIATAQTKQQLQKILNTVKVIPLKGGDKNMSICSILNVLKGKFIDEAIKVAAIENPQPARVSTDDELEIPAFLRVTIKP